MSYSRLNRTLVNKGIDLDCKKLTLFTTTHARRSMIMILKVSIQRVEFSKIMQVSLTISAIHLTI